MPVSNVFDNCIRVYVCMYGCMGVGMDLARSWGLWFPPFEKLAIFEEEEEDICGRSGSGSEIYEFQYKERIRKEKKKP